MELDTTIIPIPKLFSLPTGNYDSCILNGKYCADSPSGNKSLAGADIISEVVKQMCINSVEHKKSFFKYLAAFYDALAANGNSFKPNLVELRNFNGISKHRVEECITDSW